MNFMRGIGLAEEASSQELFVLNQSFFEWSTADEPTETKIFGAPALAIKTKEGDAWTNNLMGFINDRAFLLFYSVPSEEALQNFVPTWKRMLENIEAIP